MTNHVTSTDGMTVRAITVDEYVATTGPPPSVMKLDVEGHEEAVLRGAPATLDRYRPTVLCEFHDHVGASHVQDILAGFRYVCEGLPPVGLQRLRRKWSATTRMAVFVPRQRTRRSRPVR
jgi:hypothetical protein